MVFETLLNGREWYTRGVQPAPEPPRRLSSFIGRSRELAEAAELLGSSRLLTLTGPGGAGKTRLALELAQRIQAEFTDGVLFVSLAELHDPALMPALLARKLGLPTAESTQLESQIRQFLSGRRMLLLLDNFEQLLGDGGSEPGPGAYVAAFMGALLAAAPGAKVLATSRAPLGLSGEQEYPVGPLELPAADTSSLDALRANPAVQLFVDRAECVSAGFRLEPRNAVAVAEVCRRLDGLPLAIELAAARIRLLTPAAIAKALARRFDLLGGGAGDLPERQRSLRRAIAWSYNLLPAASQCVFRRMAVFDGGMTLEACEALCEGAGHGQLEALDALTSLLDHSMLRRCEGPGGEARFQILESIRAFGLEQLKLHGEEEEVRRMHAVYFLGLAERAKPHLTGRDQAAWFDRLDAEHANFRAAIHWALSHRGEESTGVGIGVALWRCWLVRGRIYEGRPLLEALLAKPGNGLQPEARLDALHAIGSLCHYQGETGRARQALEECAEMARTRGDSRRLAQALNGLAWVCCQTSRLRECRELAAEALALAEQEGDLRGAALALNSSGWANALAGDYPAAVSCHQRSLELRRRVGDLRGEGFALTNLAWAERIHGDFERSEQLLQQAHRLLEAVDDKVLSGWALVQRAQLKRGQGRYAEAAGILAQALAAWGAGGHRALLAWMHGVLGAVLLDWGEPERGRELLSDAAALWSKLECPWALAWIRYEQGRWMMGRKPAEARRLLQESLRARLRMGDRLGAAECVEALLEAAPPAPAAWLELYAFTCAERERLQAPAPTVAAERLGRLRAAQAASVGETAAAERASRGANLRPEELGDLAEDAAKIC